MKQEISYEEAKKLYLDGLSLLDYLYENCSIYLDRKYQKYLAIKHDITNCRLV